MFAGPGCGWASVLASDNWNVAYGDISSGPVEFENENVNGFWIEIGKRLVSNDLVDNRFAMRFVYLQPAHIAVCANKYTH